MKLFKPLRRLFKRQEEPKPRSHYREKYGYYKGHFAWDLACEWFKMGPDIFLDLYDFEFTPQGELFDEARQHVYGPIRR